ncbi:acyl-CoA thioesterase [Polymorphobacter sp.]|uniref:acyl-CoA thioesterase n=1 Tax=Polymorphobacter sp. TaxID=1909290 RepID=UPI003F71E8DD
MSRIGLPRRLDAYRWHVELQTRFADMDLQAHLNNIAIARLFEETRIRFNHFLGATVGETMPVRFLLAHIRIDYLAEVSYPQVVQVAQTVVSLGESSYRIGSAMFQEGACVALCEAVLVTRQDGGPVPVPTALRARLKAVMDDADNIGDNK